MAALPHAVDAIVEHAGPGSPSTSIPGMFNDRAVQLENQNDGVPVAGTHALPADLEQAKSAQS